MWGRRDDQQTEQAKSPKNLFFCSDLITALQPAAVRLNGSSAHRASKARGEHRPGTSCGSLGGCCGKHLEQLSLSTWFGLLLAQDMVWIDPFSVISDALA